VTTATDGLADRMKVLDETAVGEFSQTFGPRLWHFFLKRGLSRADAEALAVTCVTKVWMNIEGFRPQGPGSFERWVFRVAKHVWVDDVRRAGRRPTVGVDEHGLTDDTDPHDPNGDSVDADRDRQVAAAVAALPEVDREIIRLRHFESEEPFAEIGRRLGITGAAARVRHHRALRSLAGRLAHLRRGEGASDGGGD
jgi:RNA polymerase sigma-70 factor, ECF subfamily